MLGLFCIPARTQYLCLFVEWTPACISKSLHTVVETPRSLFYSIGKIVDCTGLTGPTPCLLWLLTGWAARALVSASSVPTLTSSHVPSLHLILDPIPFTVLQECSIGLPLPVFTWTYLFLSFINHKNVSPSHLKFSLSPSLLSSLHFPSYSSNAMFPPSSLWGQAPYKRLLLDLLVFWTSVGFLPRSQFPFSHFLSTEFPLLSLMLLFLSTRPHPQSSGSSRLLPIRKDDQSGRSSWPHTGRRRENKSQDSNGVLSPMVSILVAAWCDLRRS